MAGDAQTVSRRQILAGGALATAAPLLPVSAIAHDAQKSGQLMCDVERYAALGSKRAGDKADMAVGAWLEREMQALGFDCARHQIDVPWFEPAEARFAIGETNFGILPVGIPTQTPREGLVGTIRIFGDPPDKSALATAKQNQEPFIALAILPYARWSSAATPVIEKTITACRDAGAIAVLLATTGPTGKAIMLNASGAGPVFDIPLATIGSTDAGKIATSDIRKGRFYLHGSAGRRPAFNLLARKKGTNGRHLIVSTPRSGWFACGAERGPGIAIWLELARQIAKDVGVDATFLCTSGHEYENLGAEHLIDEALPPPADTSLWLHLGAGFAARDWHEFGVRLAPLPSVDPQRFLSASESLVADCRRLFAGQPGLEAVYSTADLLAGELKVIAARGYEDIVGLFGAHRFHHVEGDNVNCVDANAMVLGVESLKTLISELGQNDRALSK